ncbi:GNAT family N-acetyltransferase [Rhodocyclus purpureus]|uniref:GNAT family N-acetyltransferase n=1 Tax=Rhodocyclus purpureus TaxID=1067 RepID=UPI001912843C|nr:GNAT family N-acetyltransferase [Rhodocyclus purpureus]MBK5914349.1 GNAT family N-acetyltransferase [Rhodocyclus purpureus]
MPSQERSLRLLKQEDLDAIVAIDETATGKNRREYFERKIASIVRNRSDINCSLVAEVDGKVVGFAMGYLFFGEFGISDPTATIDGIGVAPEYRHHGLAAEIVEQFVMNMKAAGVKKIYTLVNWEQFGLMKFFAAQKFAPSKSVNLELALP